MFDYHLGLVTCSRLIFNVKLIFRQNNFFLFHLDLDNSKINNELHKDLKFSLITYISNLLGMKTYSKYFEFFYAISWYILFYFLLNSIFVCVCMQAICRQVFCTRGSEVWYLSNILLENM